MKNGECTKCRSNHVYRRAGTPHQREQITLSGGVVSKAAAPDTYLCAACGYLELYLPSTEHRQVVRDTWEKVEP